VILRPRDILVATAEAATLDRRGQTGAGRDLLIPLPDQDATRTSNPTFT